VLLCSGFPSQFAIAAVLQGLGMGPTGDTLPPSFVFILSGVDTVVVLGLVFYFLRRSDERPATVLLGRRPIGPELGLGALLVPGVFMLVVIAQVSIRLIDPSLHNVEVSPFAPLLSSPAMVAAFVVLVLVAGGVREEIQRAFLLHRFERHLGGAAVGLIVTSIGFGLGHTLQGLDAAIITGMLGAFWGVVYLARRSVVSTVTNHALFNVAQIALGYATLVRA
jgi:membrane protease YdiL (CAAX protease family)